MRIFYAVNFADDVKSSLYDNMAEIKKHTLKGSFTPRENFHVTLLFIGECSPSQLAGLKAAADAAVSKINPPPIPAVISGLASFARPREELLWVGMKTEPGDILNKINAALIEEVGKTGIKIKESDKNRFSPHITIARKVEFWRMSRKDIHQIQFDPVNCTIDSVTLMESVQETDRTTRRTKIIYKPLHESKFTP